MDEKNKCTLKFKNGKLLTSHYNIYSLNDSPLIRKQEIDVEKECQILLKKDSPKVEFSAIEVNALDESEGFVQFQLGMDMEHNCCERFDVVLEKEFEKVYVESIELEIEEDMEKYVDLKQLIGFLMLTERMVKTTVAYSFSRLTGNTLSGTENMFILTFQWK